MSDVPPIDQQREAVDRLLDMQVPHDVFVPMVRVSDAPVNGEWLIRTGRITEAMTLPQIWDRYQNTKRLIEEADTDHFEHGVRYPEWDHVLWEICRLRVASPDEPIEFGLFGSNGSAKTYFCANIMMEAMVQAPSLGGDYQRMFWMLALDETASETVQQKALYYWLPNQYKTLTGAVKTTQRRKLRFNQSGGFTDNQFSLDNGAQCQGRFWSTKIDTLEGVRPWCVWSDEGVPVEWLEGATRRMVTAHKHTRGFLPRWKRLLREKEVSPEMPFPREFIYDLLCAVHLVSYTFKNGYTETVSAFDGKVVKEIEADPELLPHRKGREFGGERMPKIVHCKNPARRGYYIHAWDNPIGGNWEGLKKLAMSKPRSDKLWMCYGVAERKADSPIPNFDERMHVVPLEWVKGVPATLCHAADSLANGGRTWFQLWGLIVGDYHRCFWPGDLIIVHEYPQTDDLRPGFGMGEVWAEPGGKDGVGKKGPAQQSMPVGHQFRADEILRIETKICGWMGWKVPESSRPWSLTNPWPLIAVENYRQMDSRMGEVETSTKTGTTTLITEMEELGLNFVSWGRDAGAVEGSTRVKAGEQMINNKLFFDRDLAVLDEKTGRMAVDPKKGRGPQIWIVEHCTNLIESLKHYPGIAVGDSAWKDPIDCLRAFVISNLEYLPPDLFDDDEEFSGGGY